MGNKSVDDGMGAGAFPFCVEQLVSRLSAVTHRRFLLTSPAPTSPPPSSHIYTAANAVSAPPTRPRPSCCLCAALSSPTPHRSRRGHHRSSFLRPVDQVTSLKFRPLFLVVFTSLERDRPGARMMQGAQQRNSKRKRPMDDVARRAPVVRMCRQGCNAPLYGPNCIRSRRRVVPQVIASPRTPSTTSSSSPSSSSSSPGPISQVLSPAITAFQESIGFADNFAELNDTDLDDTLTGFFDRVGLSGVDFPSPTFVDHYVDNPAVSSPCGNFGPFLGLPSSVTTAEGIESPTPVADALEDEQPSVCKQRPSGNRRGNVSSTVLPWPPISFLFTQQSRATCSIRRG
ncbi:hypothetical protein BXZ70DRAFT_395726 [Cristinia sonorae]|uniref:Uncharacterized protein n=1 Tax=Cristinia sonorae TaxID=1940300 RepID=A0A8K0XTH0_9AGAR|nr:hypothetical protein BXZ70DRAFT_395726 [Cristinia sonorae]